MLSRADGFTLFTADGLRKYVTPRERGAFIDVASRIERSDVRALCLLLAFSGCRISEALSLKRSSIDPEIGVVTIRSLKKRGRLIYRQVPIPDEVVSWLLAMSAGMALDICFCPLSRNRAWQLVKAVMNAAEIAEGPHHTPKGLRHGFAIHALRSGVPPNLVQRWLGHASIETTMIYLEAVGDEERAFASRMWTEIVNHAPRSTQ